MRVLQSSPLIVSLSKKPQILQHPNFFFSSTTLFGGFFFFFSSEQQILTLRMVLLLEGFLGSRT